ncbi:MAG: O-antigen ligase family protein [Gammaproteobacteria bacterium]|nr:O-antigen ligase family protein [Gammaproteobacteria bacterium]
MRPDTLSAGLACTATVLAVALQGFTPVTLAIVVTVVTVSVVTGLVATHGRGLQLGRWPVPVLLAGLWAWLGGVAALGALSHWSVLGLLQFSLLPAGYLVYCCQRDRPWFWRWLCITLIVLAVTLCLTVLFEYFVLGRARPSALFVQKNSLAGYLLLVLFALGARFVADTAAVPARSRSATLLGALVFTVVFTIALGASRAALGALTVAGMAFYLGLPAGARPRSGRLFAALVLWAVLAATLVPGAQLQHKAESLFEVATRTDLETLSIAGPVDEIGDVAAVNQRFILWKSSLLMWRDLPWFGTGPGTFHLRYPAWSPPEDHTDRYYAHADYLQLLIEAGYPGVLLAAALMLAVAFAALRARRLDPASRAQAAGAGAGLLAVAAQSLFTYNFYVPAILLLFGLVLARYVDLTGTGAPGLCVPLARWLRRPVFILCCSLAALVPIGSVATAAVMAACYERGVTQLRAGQLEAAERTLLRAGALYPNERVDVALALTYVAALGSADDTRRSALYALAEARLARARARNPFSPYVYDAYARLYGHAAVPGSRDALVTSAYAAALARDPRYYGSRLDFARYLEEHGRSHAARELLEDGLRYAFPIEPGILEYAALLRTLRTRAGDHEDAVRLERRLRVLEQLLYARES